MKILSSVMLAWLITLTLLTLEDINMNYQIKTRLEQKIVYVEKKLQNFKDEENTRCYMIPM